MTENNGGGKSQQEGFAAMHKAMKAALEAQHIQGWASPEVERAMTRVVLGLWACANNAPIPQTILDSLKEDMAALEAARDGIGT